MPVKIQNFLFLLGFSTIIGVLYLPIQIFLLFVFSVNDLIVISISHGIVAIATAIGIINLFDSKIAQYIYEKSTTRYPRLQWYSMFFSWTAVVKTALLKPYVPSYLIYGVWASCVIGALFYPNRTWKKRLLSAFIFLGLFVYSAWPLIQKMSIF